MKIAVWHNLPSGGGKRALYEQIKGLLLKGHTLEAWCPSSADQTYLPLSQLIPEHVVPLTQPPRKSHKPLSKSLRRYREVVASLRAMERHCQTCATEIQAGDFDIFLAGSCMFFRVAPIGRYVNLPRAIYLQEPYRWLYEALPTLPWPAIFPPRRFWWYPRYLKAFLPNLIEVQGLRVQAREELQSARAYHSIFVNSYYSREAILRAYGLDARVCYLGIDTGAFVDQQKARESFVVSVGALVPEKNIKFILDSLARVPSPRPRLVWIGNAYTQEYLKELEDYARSISVEFEAKLRITDVEVVDLLNRAAMMVYAPRLEPFGLAVLEAGACALPVVAVTEGGVRETVVDGINGLLVDYSTTAMAEAIQRLLNDRAYSRRLGSQGRQLVSERWSQPVAIDRLEARLFETLKLG